MKKHSIFNMGVIFSLICGVLISIAIFMQVHAYESRNLQREFDSIVQSYFVLISNTLSHKEAVMEGFSNALRNEFILEERDSVSQPEFDQLSNILGWEGDEVLAAAWLPLVKLTERSEFERNLRQNGLDDHIIHNNSHEEDKMDKPVENHFPVYLSRIVDSPDMVNGLDLAAVAEYSVAFKRSMVDDSIVTLYHAGEHDDNKTTFTVLYPLVEERTPSGLEQSIHHGFVAVDIDLGALIENTLTATPSHGLHIHIRDDSLPELIYTHVSRKSELVESAEFVDFSVFSAKEIKFYDRVIKLRFDATTSFSAERVSNLKWVLLSLTLLMTLAVAALFAFLAKQKAHRLIHQKLSTALDQSGQAIMITDEKGVTEYVNSTLTKITGYSADELIGRNPNMIGSGKQPAYFYENMWETILAGDVWRGQITEKRKDGSFYPAALTISPIVSDSGELINFIGVHDDLSAQKDMEEQLHQSQKLEAIGTLVGGVAHNFNNILAAIVGKAYLGHKVLGNSPEKVAKHLTSINELSHQAADMVSQLLVFSRGRDVELRNVPFVSLMKETAKTAQLGVPENINFVLRFSSESMTVHGNSTELQQVLMNLINNARDAMSDMEHGSLTVSLESQAEDTCPHRESCLICTSHVAKLTVEDTGVGISKEAMSHIFEPFFTTKAVDKGTGLGLSTLYGTIERHGGVVNVESEIGKGSKFTICIPIVNDVAEGVGDTQEHETINAKADSSILIIDDDDMIRTTLDNILSGIGYNVFTAVDGLDGIETFSQHSDDISLVITDIVMPNMNGYKAIAAIRKVSPNIPVVYITGYDGTDSEQKLELNDETKLIAKPFDIAKLSQLIHDLIDK